MEGPATFGERVGDGDYHETFFLLRGKSLWIMCVFALDISKYTCICDKGLIPFGLVGCGFFFMGLIQCRSLTYNVYRGILMNYNNRTLVAVNCKTFTCMDRQHLWEYSQMVMFEATTEEKQTGG